MDNFTLLYDMPLNTKVAVSTAMSSLCILSRSGVLDSRLCHGAWG